MEESLWNRITCIANFRVSAPDVADAHKRHPNIGGKEPRIEGVTVNDARMIDYPSNVPSRR